MRRRYPYDGTCRDCLRKRQVYRAWRSGGGNYRRGGRNYASSICEECTLGRLGRATPGSSAGRWDTHSLEDIVASLGTTEAAEVLTAWRDRKDHRRWLREARRA